MNSQCGECGEGGVYNMLHATKNLNKVAESLKESKSESEGMGFLS